MPLARIDLTQGKSPVYCRTLGDIVYEAMVDVLKSPRGDRFQVIAEYPTLNRDASLIFFDQDIARYYQDLFLFDWGRIANVGIDESIPAPEAVRADEGRIEPGRLRMSASELLGYA
jgi:hypothetical protein